MRIDPLFVARVGRMPGVVEELLAIRVSRCMGFPANPLFVLVPDAGHNIIGTPYVKGKQDASYRSTCETNSFHNMWLRNSQTKILAWTWSITRHVAISRKISSIFMHYSIGL